MQKRFFILQLFVTLLSAGLTFGQGDPTYIPKYIPPSPNVAALMKFVDVPVSPYTGTSDISVPIFEIDAKGVKVPISLNYHTGGIKVEEEAGMVGLGWALTAGGSISRTVLDQDDFKGDYFTNLVPQVSGDISGGHPVGISPALTVDMGPYVYDFACNYLVNTTAGQVDYYNLYNTPTTIYDQEPDQFSFNFLGHSGKFIIRRDKKVIEQQQDNLRFLLRSSTIR